MPAEQNTHPSEEVLRQFALGKSTGTSSTTILSHLEQCDTCREQVASLSGDSFLDRMRAAAGRSVTPMPDKPVGELPQQTFMTSGTPVIPGLPPELAGHPQYEVVRELGRGGMGVVYLARNRQMDRLEVLKVMGQELLSQPGARPRFEREIKSAARLNHSNVVTAYSVLPMESLLVFAMEYVEGEDLARVVKARGPLPVANACYYAHQVALGLQHAHEKGMVHRDIKPQNLILARDRKKHVVKVLDFGLAKANCEKGGQYELTGEGKMLGTPHYVAPEQIDDAATADIRADVYSLGCTLYFLLTGSAPFAGGSLFAILHAHHEKEAAALNEVRPDVPAGLAAVVRKMMAKDPAQRYQTPGEVAQALVPFVKPGVSPVAPGQRPMVDSVTTDVWNSVAEPTKSSPDVGPAKGRRWTISVGVREAALLAGLAAAVLAGTVVFWQTPHGWVKIASDDPDVVFVFDKTGATVKGADKEPIKLGTGEHGVLIKRGDLEFEADKFVLKKGATVTLKVELFKDKIQVSADGRVIGAKERPLVVAAGEGEKPVRAAAPGAPEGEEGFVPLFDGKTLAGWSPYNMNKDDNTKHWGVEEGAITGWSDGLGRRSYLLTDKKYADFTLRLDYKTEHACNAGVAVRAIPGEMLPFSDGRPIYDHPVMKLNESRDSPRDPLGTTHWIRDGKLYTLPDTIIQRDSGEWHSLELTIRGAVCVAKVGGDKIVDLKLDPAPQASGGIVPALNRTQGAIGFQAALGTVRFRKVRIRELTSTAATAPPEKAGGFVQLFNGKDRTGWKTHPGDKSKWTVEDGLLTGRGPMGHLFSERGDYENFVFRVEAMINDHGNSGQYFRTRFGPGFPRGYEVQINSTHGDRIRTGSLYPDDRDGYSKEQRQEMIVLDRLHEPDDWFTQEVTVIGNHFVVKVNGKTRVNFVDEKNRYPTGHFALQQHDPGTVVKFRKIEVKELPPG